jgi:hypothetical protein
MESTETSRQPKAKKTKKQIMQSAGRRIAIRAIAASTAPAANVLSSAGSMNSKIHNGTATLFSDSIPGRPQEPRGESGPGLLASSERY